MFPFRSTRSIALEAWAPFIIFVRPIGLRIAKIRFSSRTNADERRIAPSLSTTTCWVSVFIPAQELVPHLAKDARGKLCLMIRSEEHTSELQSLMRISYAAFCLQKKKNYITT